MSDLTEREKLIIEICLGDEFEYVPDDRVRGASDEELDALIKKVRAL